MQMNLSSMDPISEILNIFPGWAIVTWGVVMAILVIIIIRSRVLYYDEEEYADEPSNLLNEEKINHIVNKKFKNSVRDKYQNKVEDNIEYDYDQVLNKL